MIDNKIDNKTRPKNDSETKQDTHAEGQAEEKRCVWAEECACVRLDGMSVFAYVCVCACVS